MAQSSAAVVQAQLLVARIQVQEQRVNTINRQIVETQNDIAPIRERLVPLTVELKRVEERLTHVTAPGERRQAELEWAETKSRVLPEIAQAEERIRELTLRESELTHLFAAEQGRWIDFNTRLDALERSSGDKR
jgi:uncharacterized coiled-coil protein SlyX